jgi:hypothetical protein
MKNDILVPHGLDPLRVQMIRNQLNRSRINAVHFLKQKSCRTPVGLVPAIYVFAYLHAKKMDDGFPPTRKILAIIKATTAHSLAPLFAGRGLG